jgi:hypothetical protein
MEKNKTGKYLKYAIGEIILVVIGILIALSINNWNEHRIEENQLKEYLLTIKKNISNDILELNKDAIIRDSLSSKNKRAREEFNKGILNVETMNEAQRFFYEFYFTPNKSGYDAIKNSGLLGKLTNSSLDSLLHKYYVGLDNLHEIELSFNTFIENVEYDYRTKFPAIEIYKIIRKDTISKDEEKKILESYRSNIFQAGVLRASVQGTRLYYVLIDTGKALIEEIDQYTDK